MTFEPRATDTGYFIEALGQIEQGDRVRLVSAIDSLPLGAKIIAVALESFGGNIFEAERLASTIRSSGFSVVVPGQRVCASACFLLFASGVKRFAFPSSMIGVHSASENGQETLNSMGFTTALARDASAYGVPSAIVGKIITTEPSSVAWLTTGDLVLLDVKFLSEVPVSVVQSSNVTNNATSIGPTSLGVVAEAQKGAASSQNDSFGAGLADRKAVENWISGLNADGQAGFRYWASQRSLRKPGACIAPTTLTAETAVNWVGGCTSAKELFLQPDKKRRSDPDYKAGWNSLAQ